MKRTPLWFLPIATILLAGCPLPIFESGPPIEGGGQGGSGGSGGHDNDGDPCPTPLPKPDVSPETIAAVSALFRETCAHCHGNGEARGDLADIFDIYDLKRKGLIRARADQSPLFQLVDADQMPPLGAISPITREPVRRVTAEQKKALRDWIDGGAPELRGQRERIDLDDYQRLLRRDLASLPRAEQAETVYVSFHAAYNNSRYSDAELAAYANATLKLLNGLDPISTRVQRNGSGVGVVVNDRQVPIALRFQPARFHLTRADIDRVLASTNRQDVNNPFDCDVPAIPVGDFLQIASGDDFFNPINEQFESTYSNVMLRRLFQQSGIINPLDNDTLIFPPVPKADFIAGGFTNISAFTLADVLTSRGGNLNELGLIFNESSDSERVRRACLLNSSVTASNRCIDRFSLASPGNENATAWLTWDSLSIGSVNEGQDFFAAKFIGPANPPNDPLVRAENAFVADGGEVIFQLPNLMQGYAVYNGNLNLVTTPPSLVVNDPVSEERGNFISVRACSSCHTNFTIPFTDAAYGVALNSINDGIDEGDSFLFKIVQPQEVWDFQVADDSNRYLEELKDVYVTRSEAGELPDGIYTLGSQYLFDLSLDDVVAELGLLDANDLQDLIDNDTGLTADLRSVLGGGIARETFTVNYQALVDYTPTSTQDFLRACVTRDVSTAPLENPVPLSGTTTFTASKPTSCAY